jgi:GDP-4-dehydro-6-deoxy-D-mannose reductase
MGLKFLVVGASGFVGRKLYSRIAEQGHTAFGMDRSPSDNCTHFTVDITKPTEVVSAFRSIKHLDYIFHLAAISSIPATIENPVEANECNVTGTVNLLAAYRDIFPKARFIYVSSSEVYGIPQYLPIDEEHPLSPQNPYAITKLAAEQFCEFYASRYDLDIVRIRPFNHSGPGQSANFVLSSFAKQIAQIESGLLPPVLKVGNLQASRDFSHVDDIVEAYLQIAQAARTREIYNICSQKSFIIGELLQQLLERSNAKISVEVDSNRYRPLVAPAIYGSCKKLTDCIGYVPKRAIDNLLDDLLMYWRENP